VDAGNFDTLAKALVGSGSRRRALGGLLAGALALVGGQVEAKKNKKRKKKNKGTCQTVGRKVSCAPGVPCCDPARSTIGGCGAPGNPICCASTGAAHPAESTCCTTASAGQGGVCLAGTHPHCCPFDAGAGCCQSGFPVCCPDSSGGYCCPAGAFCCASSADGCCFAQAAQIGAEGVQSAPRGTRKFASLD
jgi:hypothetical protein